MNRCIKYVTASFFVSCPGWAPSVWGISPGESPLPLKGVWTPDFTTVRDKRLASVWQRGELPGASAPTKTAVVRHGSGYETGHRQICITHISPQLFCRESLLWRRLHHDHVLPCFGVSDDAFQHSLCMVMPWIDKGNIRQYITFLANEGQLSGPDFVRTVNTWVSAHLAKRRAAANSICSGYSCTRSLSD